MDSLYLLRSSKIDSFRTVIYELFGDLQKGFTVNISIVYLYITQYRGFSILNFSRNFKKFRSLESKPIIYIPF